MHYNSMRSRLILFHEMLPSHMKNTFSSSKEGIHDYLEQHMRLIACCAASFGVSLCFMVPGRSRGRPMDGSGVCDGS